MEASFKASLLEVIRPAWHEMGRNYARLKRRRSNAKFIAITGSSAKSTTVALLSHILSANAKVKTQVLLNSAPTTWKTLASLRQEHEYVVLELGTRAPGMIEEMTRVVQPDVAIVTMVGLDHYAAFRSKEAVAKEKGSLVEALTGEGLAILNKDDPYVAAMSNLTTAPTITFGKSDADYSQDELIATAPGSLTFLLHHKGRRIRLATRLIGAHNCLAVSAAATCALELGIPEETVKDRVASFEPVFGRMSLHAIDGGPTFLHDAYKAPYESIPLVLDVLRDCVAPRKRFVLGHMSDFPGDPRIKYRKVYRAALEVADQVLFVGDNAHRSKATKDEIDSGKFVAFNSVQQLSKYIKLTTIPGEVILLKSAKNLHLERIVLDWETEVRCWEDICRASVQNCLKCGLYQKPFCEHHGKARKVNLKVPSLVSLMRPKRHKFD